MAELPQDQQPSTTESAAKVAQSQEAETQPSVAQLVSCPGEDLDFEIAPAATRSRKDRPYQRERGAPLYRPLKIFTQDPAASKLEGSIALINVPYEKLEPGPKGAIFEVDNFDGNQHNRKLDLDDPAILLENGLDASPSNPRFHQQMVYAVCSMVYASFRAALGRHVAWSFGDRLMIRPHIPEKRNAYYDKNTGELCFGYYRAPSEVSGRNLPGGLVFTCLSHDIVVHECTHALLDGLRAHFTLRTGPDVLAFHEAFADLMAVFQRFSYEKVVRAAIRNSGGRLEQSQLVTDIATQFARTTTLKDALRTAVDPAPYARTNEPHALGSVLVAAIFEAFVTVFSRKTERYLRLATGGSGILPPGDMPHDLMDILAAEASRLASQFQSICIRAIDYCPPIDIEFGEYLRALITADYDLVPDDPWGYREALIDAFSRRKVYPRWVSSFGEDALLWSSPPKPLPDVSDLSFARLQFEGDPSNLATSEELKRQACALGQMVTRPHYMAAFGLVRGGDPRLEGDDVELPRIHSIRSSRRVGPQGQIVFDLIGEVTQRRIVRNAGGNELFDFYGGATVILGPEGEVRFVISKSVVNQARLMRQREYLTGERGLRYWASESGKLEPRPQLFQIVHAEENS